jgi:multidrug efflux pump subunit AcrB
MVSLVDEAIKVAALHRSRPIMPLTASAAILGMLPIA